MIYQSLTIDAFAFFLNRNGACVFLATATAAAVALNLLGTLKPFGWETHQTFSRMNFRFHLNTF
jgi:hypothetical protein